MPAERFDIIFSGQLVKGQDPKTAREGVRKLFKASDAQLQRLFSGKPVSIKKGVDLDTAAKYRAAFRRAGALVDILPGQATASTAPQPASGNAETARPTPAEPAMSLAPANSGSLEQYAERVEPSPLPDISGLDLSAPGVDMDDTQPPPKADIPTDGIELVEATDQSPIDSTPAPPDAQIPTDDFDLVEAENWTLEDCQPEVLPVAIAETEQLSLADPDDTSHIPVNPPAAPLPDISDLQLEEHEPPKEKENPFE